MQDLILVLLTLQWVGVDHTGGGGGGAIRNAGSWRQRYCHCPISTRLIDTL